MGGAKDKKERGKKRSGWWAHIGVSQNEHTERGAKMAMVDLCIGGSKEKKLLWGSNEY